MTLKDMPSSAKKSAVIISQDGEIVQHIPHEEDNENVLGGTIETVEDNLPPTVNQVVYVNTAEEEPVVTAIPITKSKFNIKLVLTPVVMLILIVPIYNLFSPSDETETNTAAQDDSQPAEIDKVVAPVVAKIEHHPQSISRLKKLANNVIEDNQQMTSNIDLFVDTWNLMDNFSRQDFSSSFWMRRFRSLLAQKIDTFESTGENYSADHAINYRNSLINMAALVSAMDVVDDASSKNVDLQFEQLFEKISSELAMAEMNKKLSDSQRSDPDSVEQVAINSERRNDTNKIIKPAATLLPAASTAKTSTKGFTESDLNYLLGQYSTIYEFGSTKKIMKLFSAKRAYKRALKKNFDKVFNYSSDRSIRFSKFSWQFFNNSIVGHGSYHAKITLKQDKGVRHVSANIRVKFHAEKERLRIARMNFSKVKVRLVKPKSSERIPVDFSRRKTKLNANASGKTRHKGTSSLLRVSGTNKASRRQRLKIPTAAELQDIVTRFIGAYEAGNINALDKIFSANAKTNDQNGLSEIKKDYQTLFSSTTDRQLFIQDIKWTIVNDYARGKGVLNILIVSDGSNAIESQQGEIQITAKKNQDKLLITHLFHDLRR